MKLQGSSVRLTSVTAWETLPQTTRLDNYLHRGPIRRATPEQDGRNQSPRLVMRNIFLTAAERLISGLTNGSTGPLVLRSGVRGWTAEQGYLWPCSPLTKPGLRHRSPAPWMCRWSSAPAVLLPDKHPLIGTSALTPSFLCRNAVGGRSCFFMQHEHINIKLTEEKCIEERCAFICN